MRIFQYQALTTNGNSVAATCEAESRSDALLQLKSQGLCTLTLEDITGRTQASTKIEKAVVARFYSLLGNQLQVGVPLINAIGTIAQQERSPHSKRFVQAIAHAVEAGDSLSNALSPHDKLFTTVDLSLIRAGEEGGFLADALDRISQMREWQQKLTANAWGAAAYPLLLVTVACLLVPALLVFLVPKLEPIFASLRRDARLPWATSALLTTSKLFQEYGMLVVTCLVAIAIAVYITVPRNQVIRFRDRLLMRIPYVGEIARDFMLARFFRVLGTLLQNKIQIINALEISTNVLGNQCLAKDFRAATESVATGKLLVDALERTSHIPPEALAMIGVAEHSNTLDAVLIKVAGQLEARTNRRLETAVKLIEPLLLLVMAFVVGFVVLALLLPIFEGQSLD